MRPYDKGLALKPAKFLCNALKQTILPVALRSKEEKISERAENELEARRRLVSNGLQVKCNNGKYIYS